MDNDRNDCASGTMSLGVSELRGMPAMAQKKIPRLVGAALVTLAAVVSSGSLLAIRVPEAVGEEPAPNGSARFLLLRQGTWTLAPVPEGTRSVCPRAATAGGRCVIASAMPIRPQFDEMRPQNVPEVDRTCYLLNVRWPSGHSFMAKEGRAFGRVAFSEDGTSFVAEAYGEENRWADYKSELSCFSGADGRLLGTAAFDLPGPLTALALSPSGNHIFCASNHGMAVYAVPDMRRCYLLDRPNNGVSFSADGRYAVIAEFLAGPEPESAVEPPEPKQARQAAPRYPCEPAVAPTGNATGGTSQTGTGDQSDVPNYVPGSTGRSSEGKCQVRLVELRTMQVCWHFLSDRWIYNPVLSSDGGILAFEVSLHEQKAIEVWDTRRGKRIARLDVPSLQQFLLNSNILAVLSDHSPQLAFYDVPSCERIGATQCQIPGEFSLCGGGYSVAIAEGKSRIGIWGLKLAEAPENNPQHREWHAAAPSPSQAEFSRWYDTLGGPDATAARLTMRSLESSGDAGVEFLKTRLKPESVGEAEILALVRALDSDDYRVREAAFRRGEAMARAAKVQLQQQMALTKSAEVRASLRRILASVEYFCIRDMNCLRSLRAIECLEVIASRRSRQLLSSLASGSPSSPVTQDARAALDRMNLRVSADDGT
jgi:hypothetical protein